MTNWTLRALTLIRTYEHTCDQIFAILRKEGCDDPHGYYDTANDLQSQWLDNEIPDPLAAKEGQRVMLIDRSTERELGEGTVFAVHQSGRITLSHPGGGAVTMLQGVDDPWFRLRLL